MGLAATYISALSFSVAGDQTGLFKPGRKIRCTCGSSYKYCYVDTSTYSNSLTTVYINQGESQTLTNDLSEIDASVIKPNVLNEGNLPIEYIWLIRGQQTICLVYKDSGTITLKPGIIHINNGVSERTYRCIGFDKALSGLSASEWQYIYVKPPSSGIEITANEVLNYNTAPTLNSLKQGYYHPIYTSWRCIGAIRTHSTGVIIPFGISGNRWITTDRPLNNDTTWMVPSTTWTDYTFIAPAFAEFVIARHEAEVIGNNSWLIYRKKGSTWDPVSTSTPYDNINMGFYAVSNLREGFVYDFPISNEQKGQFKFNIATTNDLHIWCLGYVLPSEIYTLGGSGAASSNTLFDTTVRGLQSISVEYKDTSSVFVNPGSCHIWGSNKEDVYQVPSQLIVTLTNLVPETWYAIYIVPPTTGNTISIADIQYASVMPVRDLIKMGWYHPLNVNWRCIGFVYCTESDGIWSADVTSTSYIHTSNNVYGTPTDLSNNVLSGGLQNFSYVTIDFGAGNEKKIQSLRLYFINSYAYDNGTVSTAIFKGSNDGSTWTTLYELENLQAPSSYPGWTPQVIFTNNVDYRYYSISGTLQDNNTVITEWELYESLIENNSKIAQFSINDNRYLLNDSTLEWLVNVNVPTTDFMNTTAVPVPMGGITAIFHVYTPTSNSNVFYRTPGASGTIGSRITRGVTSCVVDMTIGSDKTIELIAFSSGSSNYIDVLGFTLPPSMYTGASGGLTRTINSAFDITKTGHQAGLGVVYRDTASVDIKAGSIHLSDGSTDRIYVLSSQVTKSFTNLLMNTWYAIYVKIPVIGTSLSMTEIEYSTVMPQEEQSKGGWYHPINSTWRCLCFIRTNSTSQIEPFKVVSNIFRFTDNDHERLVDLASSGTPKTTTADAPIGNILMLMGWWTLAGGIVGIRETGTTGTCCARVAYLSNSYKTIASYIIPINIDKQYDYYHLDGSSSNLYEYVHGYIFPSGIGAGTSGIGRSLNQSFDVSKIGHQAGMDLVYVDSSNIKIKSGSVHISDGYKDLIYRIPSSIIKSMTGLAANSWYSIYVAPPANESLVLTTNEIQYSSTMPSEDETKGGWYHPSNQSWRCIGFIRSLLDSTIQPFNIMNDLWISTDQNINIDINGSVPSNSWTTYTFTVPIGGTSVYGRLSGLYSNAGSWVAGRLTGTSYSGSNNTPYMYVSATVSRQDLYIQLPLNSLKQYDFKWADACTNSIYFYNIGFQLPKGIGTNNGSIGQTTESLWDASKTGFRKGIQIEYNSITDFIIKAGQLHISNGATNAIYTITTQLTKSVVSLTANTWYAVYACIPSNGTTVNVDDIQYTTTMPIEDQSRLGWYHPTNFGWRCIGIIRTNAAGNILDFTIYGSRWVVSGDSIATDLNGVTPSNTWTSYTFTVPSFSKIAIATVLLAYWTTGTGALTARTRRTGSGDTAGVWLGTVNAATPSTGYTTIEHDFVLSNGSADLVWSSVCDGHITVTTRGFVFPDNM